MAPPPNGSTHEVPLDDLFFSTTDAKGVIDEVNEVFTRNARYQRDALIGAPHNIIRHPDMPGGVFRLMWDQLAEGVPVTAYVLNLAGDGSAYWAFATVVPIGDRYLSVRSRPCNLDARELLHGLYQQVRSQENAARSERNLSAAAAAELGRDLLADALNENGYASYADFQLDLVPEEIAAREAAGPSLPTLNGNASGAAEMIARTSTTRSNLGIFALLLTESLQHADVLARDVQRVRQPLQVIQDSSDLNAELVAAATAAAAQADAVKAELLHVTHLRKKLRLSTAIARLQAEAIARYVIATVEELEDPRESERALSSLTEALLAILDADLDADRAATSEFTSSAQTLADTVAQVVTALRADTEAQAADDGQRREFEVAADTLTDLVTRIRTGATTLQSTTADLDRDALASDLGRVVDLSQSLP